MGDSPFKDDLEEEDRVKEILRRLESEFEISRRSAGSAFLSLVRTVLSQNTNRRNSRRAFEKLISRYDSASEIAEADFEELQELIRPAGLFRTKSKVLKKLAGIVTERYGGDLKVLLKKPVDEARGELLKMSGVGPKTADCVLLFAGGRDVLPVDTHVSRISKRLGFADQDSDPEGVKAQFEPLIPEGNRGKLHLFLIELGREYCKAMNPICEECPIEEFCPRIGVN